MKLIGWIFNITQRHRRDINRYEDGGAFSRILTLLISFVFIAASGGLEFLFLNSFFNPPEAHEMGTHIAKLLVFGILAIAFALATLDYCVCFTYVGFKNAILGEVSTDSGFRLFDMLVGLIELALAALISVGSVVFSIYFPVWFV